MSKFTMYVTVSGEDRLDILEMDSQTGVLNPQASVGIPGRPAPLAISHSKNFLYVAKRETNQITSFEIDRSDGTMMELCNVSVGSDACYLAVDHTDRFLFSSYYSAGKIMIHRLRSRGAIDPSPIEERITGSGAHSIQTDMTNRFAFVPHIAAMANGESAPNSIFQFKVDEATGKLEPNIPSEIVFASRLGPRHFCFHPKGEFCYFTNEQDSSITAFTLNGDTGTLIPFQTISTLPANYRGPNTCAQIQITPCGSYLYAPNRGHDTIACFAIDPFNGKLQSIGNVVTEPIPRAVCVDPSGRFFYAAGLASGRIASYEISPSGNLRPLHTYNIGESPMWIHIADFGL